MSIPAVDVRIDREPVAEGAVRLRLAGALDLVSRDAVFAAGMQVLVGPPTSLLLNLSKVSFIDSTGLGALIALAGEANDRAKPFAIEEPSARAERVLSLTGLYEMWITGTPPPTAAQTPTTGAD